MSNNTAGEFVKLAVDSIKLASEIRRIDKQETSDSQKIVDLVSLAKKYGYSTSEDDLKKAIQSSGELVEIEPKACLVSRPCSLLWHTNVQ